VEKLSCHLAYGQRECKEGANAIQGFGEGRGLGYDARTSYGLRVEKLGWTAGQDRQRQSVTGNLSLWYEVPSNGF
jgi:hypothetical protein